MPNDYIPLSVPDLGERERDAVCACIESTWVSSAGQQVTDLEERMASLCGRQHGVAVVNGTAALHLTLESLGIKHGAHVVVPDWTFAATANAVFHAGAKPYLVDIDERTWTLDADALELVLAEEAGKIAAVICVHTLGHAADLDALTRICDEARVPLVEDAAGAIGASYKGKPLGSFGHSACFSYNGNKIVTAGGGGMIVTDDEEFAQKARFLSTQAREGRDYVHTKVGWNYRMPNLNAAVAIAQLERLDEMIAAKRDIAGRYDSAFTGIKGITSMPHQEWAGRNFWLYPIMLSACGAAGHLVNFLEERGIQARRFWHALSSQLPYRGLPKKLNGVSQSLTGRVVCLPCSSSLTAAQQDRVIEAVSVWFARASAAQNRVSTT